MSYTSRAVNLSARAALLPLRFWRWVVYKVLAWYWWACKLPYRLTRAWVAFWVWV